MQAIRHRSYAKINLGLSILGKRSDGYHNIATIFQEIDLFDELIFHKTGQPGIKIRSNDQTLPVDASNLVHKAIATLLEHADEAFGVDIMIEKKIPTGGGLGGGSSNAAMALRVVNEWLQKPLTINELLRIGAGIGSDVPFFLLGGTAFGEGRGEILTPLFWDLSAWICLICPGIHVSTAWAYNEMKIALTNKEKFTKFKPLFQEVSPHALGKLENEFEGMVFRRHPILLNYKELLLEGGAFYASMSGSGSSIFGIFLDREPAQAAKSFFQMEKGVSAYLCKPIMSSEN